MLDKYISILPLHKVLRLKAEIEAFFPSGFVGNFSHSVFR